MPNAKSIGWAIYAAGFVVWLFGYLSAGHVSVIDWPWWISSFVPNLEAELGLALMFASMIPIYWRVGRKRAQSTSHSPMSDSFNNVVRLSSERRERADRQRALASAYRLEAAVAHIPADVRSAVVKAIAKALKQERPDAFRRLPWPWCERLLEWWDLRIETKRKARVVVPLPTLR